MNTNTFLNVNILVNNKLVPLFYCIFAYIVFEFYDESSVKL